jgi:hypothetical protein
MSLHIVTVSGCPLATISRYFLSVFFIFVWTWNLFIYIGTFGVNLLVLFVFGSAENANRLEIKWIKHIFAPLGTAPIRINMWGLPLFFGSTEYFVCTLNISNEQLWSFYGSLWAYGPIGPTRPCFLWAFGEKRKW